MGRPGILAMSSPDVDTSSEGAYVVVTQQGRDEIAAAAPGHVSAVRRLFVDRLTPRQLEAVRAVAEAVLAALDEPPQRPLASPA